MNGRDFTMGGNVRFREDLTPHMIDCRFFIYIMILVLCVFVRDVFIKIFVLRHLDMFKLPVVIIRIIMCQQPEAAGHQRCSQHIQSDNTDTKLGGAARLFLAHKTDNVQ